MPSFQLPTDYNVNLFNRQGSSISPSVLQGLLQSGDFANFSTDPLRAIYPAGGGSRQPLLFGQPFGNEPFFPELIGSFESIPGPPGDMGGQNFNILPSGTGLFDAADFAAPLSTPISGPGGAVLTPE